LTVSARAKRGQRRPFVQSGQRVLKRHVKAMFFAYLVVIVAGCGACIVIGLSQQ